MRACERTNDETSIQHQCCGGIHRVHGCIQLVCAICSVTLLFIGTDDSNPLDEVCTYL